MNAERPPERRPARQRPPTPGLFGLLVVLVVVVAVVALYLSTRREAPVQAEESVEEREAADPFAGLPPEEPPAKQAQTKGQAARAK